MMFSVPLEINLGVITVWSGAIDNIPPGWFLCDGTNGTPDLRDRFVPSTGPLFAVGAEGGTVLHNHFFTSDTHSHALVPAGALDTPADGTLSNNTDAVVASGFTDDASLVPSFFALAHIQFNGV